MTGDEAAAHLARRLPDRRPDGPGEPLPGGLLNEVFRVRCGGEGGGSVVVKHAPPFVATAPDIPLDPSRATFEARALAALGEGGRLAAIVGEAVRAPRLLDHDEAAAVVVMEDLGALPDLADALASKRAGDASAMVLGAFVAALHRESAGDAELAAAFDNAPVQATRQAVQYEAVAEMAERAAVPDAAALGARAVALGERLRESPGACLTMGDLWPRSVLIAAGGTLRVIDWELAHHGSPAQDLGHLAAHLWMHGHRAPGAAAAMPFLSAWRAFLNAYAAALGEEARRALWTAARREDAAVHWGCEILARATGPFVTGGCYEGLSADDAFIREAGVVAADLLRSPGDCAALAALAS